MNMRWTAFITICLLLTTASAGGEWVYYDNNSDIRALHQVGDTLWIATNGGLLAFQLSSGEIRGKLTAGPVLPDNSVRAVNFRGGRLYVGTDGGVVVLGDNAYLNFDTRQSPAFRDVRSIDFGVTNDVYVSTFGHGVGVIEEQQRSSGSSSAWDVEPAFRVFHLTREDSLLDNKVYSVAAIDTGEVYFGTSLGFCAYRDSAWVGFQAGAGLPRGEVRQVLHAGGDVLYLLVRGRGIYRFKDTRARRVRTPADFPAASVAAITIDSTGVLWAAGRFGGIGRHQGGSWTMYGEGEPAVAGAKWRCAYTGPAGTVYFGSADGVVAMLDDGVLRTLKLQSTLPSGFVGPMVESGGEKFIINGSYLMTGGQGGAPLELDTELGSVFALAVAPDGSVWVSAPWGLLRRDAEGWEEIQPAIDPRPPVFLSLTFDAAGNLWAGGHNGEVYRYDGDLWVPYARHGQLVTTPILRVLVDSQQVLWAVSRAGVHRYEGTKWQSFGEDIFGESEIQDATLDANGRIVVATDYKIWRYDLMSGWVAMARPAMASGRNRTIRFDTENRLYVGTEAGLAVAGADTTLWLDAPHGLRGKDVTSLMIDSEDVLWVGFRRDGISRIPLAGLRR